MFIDKFSNSEVSKIKSFAKGLSRDLDTIENAVAYPFSNGFVEGTNSKLKMVKRTMYGRQADSGYAIKVFYNGLNQEKYIISDDINVKLIEGEVININNLKYKYQLETFAIGI